MPAVVHHQAAKRITGVVVSAGKMMKTVKVQVPKQKWNKRIQKYYATPYNVLVSDPTDAAREGDVVSIQAGYRASKHVHHVIADIVAPMGPPLSQRPHLMTEAERIAALMAKREAKDEKQAANGRLVAIKRVQEKRQSEEILSKLQAERNHDEGQSLKAKAKANPVDAAEEFARAEEAAARELDAEKRAETVPEEAVIAVDTTRIPAEAPPPPVPEQAQGAAGADSLRAEKSTDRGKGAERPEGEKNSAVNSKDEKKGMLGWLGL